jgi:hypothetical protein
MLELDFNEAPLQPSAEEETPHIVRAFQVTTGAGKTSIAAEIFGDGRKEAKEHNDNRPLIYFVPTHRLGEDIAGLFAERGLTARVWRGRDNPVPGNPGRMMCDDIDKVSVALKCGLPVGDTCCKHKKIECPFYLTCEYQKQARSSPDVWIIAHQGLFHANAAIDEPAGIVIDESFWQDGIVLSKWSMPISAIRSSLVPPAGKEMTAADLQRYREMLADALGQPELGGVRSEYARKKLTDEECTKAITLEWFLMPDAGLKPDATCEQIALIKLKTPQIQIARRMVRIWKMMRELLQRTEANAVSGRIYLEDEKGTRVVKLRSLKAIPKQWQAHTVILDATLPGKEILQAYHPQVEVVGRWHVMDLPHVEIRQYLNAPVTKQRLMKTITNGNRDAIRRHILQRWIETGRQETLIICQQDYEKWLAGTGLPENIKVEHFNNVSGLDRHKGVRLLISIGRTLPSPDAVEALAAALTGLEPQRVEEQADGRRWYKPEIRGGLLADGTFPAIQCDTHPDPTCEAIRFQICEGEIIQAIGRGRAVNRMAETPLDIDVLANVCLPVKLTAISIWKEPSSLIDAWVDGILVTGATDLCRLWPQLWETERAARHALRDLCAGASDAGSIKSENDPQDRASDAGSIKTMSIKHARRMLYQTAGKGMQKRHGFFDPAVIPDPRAWLEERLGPLAYFEVVVAS